MGIAIDKNRISDKAWGDVDKSAMGRRLAAAFKAGEISRDVIEACYAVVPVDAFGKDADGNEVFYASKAAYPFREMMGDALVLNKNGVHAAAQRMASAEGMGAGMMKNAKAKLRAAYKMMKEDAPASLKESVTRMEKGAPLNELVNGSVENTLDAIREDFRAQFGMPSPYDGNITWCPYHIVDTFVNAVVVCAYSIDPDEYFAVGYTREGDKYVFANRDQWQLVELAWKPVAKQGNEGTRGNAESINENKTQSPAAAPAANAEQTAPAAETIAAAKNAEMNERAGKNGNVASEYDARTRTRGKGRKFVETVTGGLTLVESDQSSKSNPDGPWKVKAIGITADVVNRNGRRYSEQVLREAVTEAKTHLNESLGQGRLIRLLGEPEHPEDKSTRRPTLLETVVNWTDLAFDGTHVLLEGLLLGTQQGRDIHAQMAGGVFPDISQRSRGDSHVITENGTRFEDVDWCVINGYDLVANGQGSDPEAGVTFSESRSDNPDGESSGDEEMDPEKLKQLLAENPQLLQEAVSGLINAQGEATERRLREKLGIPEGVNFTEALNSALEAQKKLDEANRKAAVTAAIVAATANLKYGTLNENFKDELVALDPQTPEQVKTFAESLTKRYDALMAQARLAQMGHRGVQVIGSVLENETGYPEFTKASFQFNERLVGNGYVPARDFRKPKTRNEQFTAQLLERFDQVYGAQLRAEAKRFDEAEQTSDLSLPYSVSRTVTAAVWSKLIAVSVFDFGVIETSPTSLFFEQYSAETGLQANSAAPESAVVVLDTWVDLARGHINPDSVVVKDVTDTTTYDEDADYVIDYYNGKIMALSTGAIGNGDTVHLTYTYEAIRKGEMQKIERAKVKLASKTITAKADRLATQISSEAIVFSRSQIGWDATARTLNALINEIRRKIDKDILFRALASVRSVANNSAGTWTIAADPLSDAVKLFGSAKQKVLARRYEPDSILLSDVNAEQLSNWTGFTAAGKFPDADLNAEGYIGRLKGKPVFTSTEFTNGYGLVVNRELVAYRVLQPMVIKGPFPSFEDGQLVAAEQYYAEEYNAADSPLPDKGSFVRIV